MQADAQPPRQRQRPLPVVGDQRQDVVHQIRRTSCQLRLGDLLLQVVPLTNEDGKPFYENGNRMECSAKQGECVADVQCQTQAPTE